MPPKTRTRRSLPSQAQQSTLSFNNKSTKVTKSAAASSTPTDKKASSKLNNLAQDEVIDQISSPEPTLAQIKPEQSNIATSSDEVEEDEVAIRPKNKTRKARISGGSTASAREEQDSLESAIAAAEKITEAQITKYWKAEEDARIAPRVHQEGLPTHEKVLRHFDLSSQYGPCIGIPRLNRWKRAQTLHMNPPLEVLAVLLKEESKGVDRGDKKKNGQARQCGRLAYIDELAGGKVVLVE